MKKLTRNTIIEIYKNDKAQQNDWNKKIKANSKHGETSLWWWLSLKSFTNACLLQCRNRCIADIVKAWVARV